MVAPGETILLYEDDRGVDQLPHVAGCSIGVTLHQRTLRARVQNALRRRWEKYNGNNLGSTDLRRVQSFIAKYKPVAMLAEYGPLGCKLRRACRQAQLPLYVHFHGFDASRLLRGAAYRRQYRVLFRDAAGIVAPSQFLARKLAEAGCPFNKLHVNPCGVDPIRFRSTRRRPERLLAVGRLVEKKAPHLTIEAFAHVCDQFPNARLDVIGGGPLEGRCRSLIDALGLNGRVHLHGIQDSDFVQRAMSTASIFVQHSVTSATGDAEGLPVAILEAMASSLPVVSTRHSGIPEAVRQDATGLLVEERDVVAMGVDMSKLLADPDRAKRMGEAGRTRVLEHFSLERSRDGLREIMCLDG